MLIKKAFWFTGLAWLYGALLFFLLLLILLDCGTEDDGCDEIGESVDCDGGDGDQCRI